MIQDLLNNELILRDQALHLEYNNEFRKQIQTLSIPELEQLAELLRKKGQTRANEYKLRDCLYRRKQLLTEQFD